MACFQRRRVLAALFVVVFAFSSLAEVQPLPYVSGYAGSWSNPSGQPAAFYLSGLENANAELHIYDLSRNSVAQIAAPIKTQSIANPEPWVNGFGYEPQTLDLPQLQSGVYFLSGPEIDANRIPFIVSAPETQADVVVIYPTNTVNAYSQTDGISLYSKIDGQSPPGVSFHRPQDVGTNQKVFTTRGLDLLLPAMSDEVTYKYVADSDLESYDAIAGAKMVIVPGHSEYWTTAARRNFDQFVEHGGASLVLSGNTMFRRVGFDDTENPTQLTFSPRRNFSGSDYPTWESIGVDFEYAGNGSAWDAMRERIISPYDGWKVLDATPSYLADENVTFGQIVAGGSVEFDGVPYTECDPVTGPVVDTELMGFYDLDLIAFENTTYGATRPSCAAWIDFRQEESSGRQISVGSINASLFSSSTTDLRRRITKNMIELLLIDQADFDGNEILDVVDLQLLFDEMRTESPSLRYDLTEDSLVSIEDAERWLVDFAGTNLGDANLDGEVNFNDFLALSANFLGYQEANWSQGDFNGDLEVSFSDFLILSKNYNGGIQGEPIQGEPSSTLAAVPEPGGVAPAGIGLLALMLLAAGQRARRRMH